MFAWNTEAEPRLRRLLHASSCTACAPTCGSSVYTGGSDRPVCRFSLLDVEAKFNPPPSFLSSR